MSDSWAIVASAAIAAGGAVAGALTAALAARSGQNRASKVEWARALRQERRAAYLELSDAVAGRVSALERLRDDLSSDAAKAAADAATESMWRASRRVRLAGPKEASDAAYKLVRHYATDEKGWPPHGGSDLEGEFVQIAWEVLGSNEIADTQLPGNAARGQPLRRRAGWHGDLDV